MPKPAADDEENGPHELRNLFVKEISLVGRAANRRRFLLFKSDQGADMPTLTDEEAQALEERLNTPVPDEDKLLGEAVNLAKVAKADLSDADKNAIRGTLRLLGKVKDAVGDAVMKKLASLAGYGYDAPEAKQKSDEDEAAKKKAVEEKKVAKAGDPPAEVLELAKAGDYEAVMKAAGTQPEVIAVMVQLLKSRDSKIADLEKFQAESIARTDDTAVAALVDEADLPGASREDQIKLVKRMDTEGRQAWLAHAKGIKANIQSGVLAKTSGTGRRGNFAVTAWETARERAQVLISKSDGKLKEVEAIQQVLDADPELAMQYRAQVRSGEVNGA